MLPRDLTPVLHRRLETFPAVLLVGPRQCGKTTLARSLGQSTGGAHFNLEAEEERLRLDALWPAVMEGKDLAIFDEAQHMPGLLARLRGEIDQDRKRNGRFLLLGSVSPELMRGAGESLASAFRCLLLQEPRRLGGRSRDRRRQGS